MVNGVRWAATYDLVAMRYVSDSNEEERLFAQQNVIHSLIPRVGGMMNMQARHLGLGMASREVRIPVRDVL